MTHPVTSNSNHDTHCNKHLPWHPPTPDNQLFILTLMTSNSHDTSFSKQFWPWHTLWQAIPTLWQATPIMMHHVTTSTTLQEAASITAHQLTSCQATHAKRQWSCQTTPNTTRHVSTPQYVTFPSQPPWLVRWANQRGTSQSLQEMVPTNYFSGRTLTAREDTLLDSKCIWQMTLGHYSWWQQ